MSEGGRHLGYVLKRFPRISETFVASELIELERQGERVSVFALSRPDEPFTHGFLSELSAPVVYLPHRPLHSPARVARAVAHVVRHGARGWLAAAATSLWTPRLTGLRRLLQATVLRRELEAAGVDHVHAHFASTAAGLAYLARRMGGPPYSVTAHAKDIYHREVRADRLRAKLTGAAFVATVSPANAEHLETLLGPDARVCVIPNAVDLRRLAAPARDGRDDRAILSVARLVEKKGLDDVVAACGILARRGVPQTLHIVGDGPLRRKLEAAATSARVDAVFHGALRYEDVLALYRRAAAFCLPCVVTADGDRDGLPTSALEAMALGVPVVATALNGLRELVVDGETGLVVPPRDPAAVAAALERVLLEPALAGRLAAGGRELVERSFSLERSVTMLRALFAEVG